MMAPPSPRTGTSTRSMRRIPLLLVFIFILAASTRAFAPVSLSSRQSSQLHLLGKFLNRPSKEQQQQQDKPPRDDPVVRQTTETPITPQETAFLLKQRAEQARLEAQYMESQLNLKKIEYLEQKLKTAQPDEMNDLQLQLERLLTNVNTLDRATESKTTEVTSSEKKETHRDAANGAALSPTAASTLTSDNSSDEEATVMATPTSSETTDYESIWPNYIIPFQPEVFQVTAFFAGLQAGYGGPAFRDVLLEALRPANNNTEKVELIELYDAYMRFDFTNSTKPAPNFDSLQIAGMVQTLSNDDNNQKVTELNAHNIAGDRVTVDWTDTDVYPKDLDVETKAKLVLEYNYYLADFSFSRMSTWRTGNTTDDFVSTLYPKSVLENDSQPTEAQVKQLIVDVLQPAGFACTSRHPEKIAGGYIVRGSTKMDNGQALIDAIDQQLAKSKTLKDKLTVLYCHDFTLLGDETWAASNTFLQDEPPVLYIVGADVCRQSQPFRLSLVTAAGIATSWYLSLYPFLLNSLIASRVDEELALVDANMAPDLSWLTDLSLPLFASFMGIQLAGELGHNLAAAKYDLKTSPPTFVPSIITGITSTVTSLKSLPPNRAAMFDFAVTGPVTGILASIVAIFVGSQLTAAAPDTSLFPALPLEILRQSTLGGGIIESVLGNGALSVPTGAANTEAVAGMTVPLHPVAVAGYISLVVNALSILPIGTTDGGRAAITMFGRPLKSFVGSMALCGLLLVGLGGSDLFLFYFGFCVAFQPGSDVPMRNEVDSLDIPRVFFATIAYIVAALALIPFQ